MHSSASDPPRRLDASHFERTQKTLLTVGTQIFGSTSDLDAAINVARNFYNIDPYMVKRYGLMFDSEFGVPRMLDHEPVEFSIEEQHFMRAYRVKEQPAFHFEKLCCPAPKRLMLPATASTQPFPSP